MYLMSILQINVQYDWNNNQSESLKQSGEQKNRINNYRIFLNIPQVFLPYLIRINKAWQLITFPFFLASSGTAIIDMVI